MREKNRKIVLAICNILLVLIMITATLFYSEYMSKSQAEIKKSDFIRTVESLKSVSQNYLNGEQGYIKDWASYISENKMTLEEALDFLRSINTNDERFVHIVDMDSYEAYTSYYPQGKEKIDIYLNYKDPKGDWEALCQEMMQGMFSDTDQQFRVLGKYRIPETQTMAIGVGTRVTLHTEAGEKAYLMLRIIPIEVLKKSWIFPTEYSAAEIGMITRNGDYVVQSASMRSQNFIEYIRGYNFQNDYNEAQRLQETLKENANGTLEYKNFKGTDCMWYYSSFGEGSSVDILGFIDQEDLKASADAWYIILIVCGTLLLLMVIDGIYLISMNRRLRETARLSEQANRAKTQFLSAMSHDIRTPLNAVLGMMTLAKNRSEDAKYVEQCMDKGMQSGKHLLTLINDVLDISKIESGKVSLNPEVVSLEEMMHDLTDMQEQNLARKNIRLRTDFSIFPYRYIYADKMRLNQIYVNLLTNAIKYTEDGGKISLRLYEEDIPNDTDRIRLVFDIRDNGMGMTEEFQKTMYRNFSREINTQVNSIQGTGLGLSIVKQMVDLMGGTITCESALGKGTNFNVSIAFPVAKDVKEKKTGEKNVQKMGQMHLLAAEDNDLNWEILYELVSAKGISCDRARNGEECVEILKKAPEGTYSAILMDVHMPVMDGYQATKAIRLSEQQNGRRIPIIAMTADAFAEDVKACKECGMDGHIAKPINMEILFSWLEKIEKGKL